MGNEQAGSSPLVAARRLHGAVAMALRTFGEQNKAGLDHLFGQGADQEELASTDQFCRAMDDLETAMGGAGYLDRLERLEGG